MNTVSKPVRISFYGRRIIYICPKCGKPLTFRRKYHGSSLCIKCGQRLDWSPLEKLHTETVTAEDAVDAAIIAERYYTACGMDEKEWFNLDEFRKSVKQRELYLLFKDPKEYGRFKRMNGGRNLGGGNKNAR